MPTKKQKNFLQTGTQRSGPILFFLHGFPDGPEAWRAQLDEFSEEYLCLAPYACGLQKPEKRKNYSLNGMLTTHMEILKQVDAKEQRAVFVVGHDLGAIHAWNLARKLGSRCQGLAVINGPALEQMRNRIKNPSQLRKSWYIGFFQLPFLPELLMRQWGEHLLVRLTQRDGYARGPYSTEQLADTIEHYRQIVRDAFFSLLRKKPKRLSAPVLVLCGKKDRFLDLPTEDEISPFAATFEIRVIDSGHWPQATVPQRVNEILRKFIEKASAS